MMDEVNHRSSQSPTPSSISSNEGGSKKVDADGPRFAGDNKETTPAASPTARSANCLSESASLAAVVEAANFHRNLVPGLAESLGTSSSVGIPPSSRGAAGAKHNSSGDEGVDSQEMACNGHPLLPTIGAVSKTALRLINDFNLPPFVTMSTQDSAPQLKLEDPALITSDNNPTSLNLRRRLVVKGGTKLGGYRMSRATHGVSHGMYYYEAIIMGEGGDTNTLSGVKRPLHETSANQEGENAAFKSAIKKQNTGHVRIGWSKRTGDLQAPVGYDASSYAVRDQLGSRIHQSRREDKWGGSEFGPGDVVGFAICLSGERDVKPSTTLPSLDFGSSIIGGGAKNEGLPTNRISTDSAVENYIRLFINGKQIGDKVFDHIDPGTYYPAVSCYSDASLRLNFGPHFVYPPQEMPGKVSKVQPVSDLSVAPPSPDGVLDKVLSTCNEGKKPLESKKVDIVVLNAFKDLVRKEAAIRHNAYVKHTELHKHEILKFRKERGLSTIDLEDTDVSMTEQS